MYEQINADATENSMGARDRNCLLSSIHDNNLSARRGAVRSPSYELPGSRGLEPAGSPFIEARLCRPWPSHLI
jgi:hypothetical protein